LDLLLDGLEGLSSDLGLTDRLIDLLGEGLDLGLRVNGSSRLLLGLGLSDRGGLLRSWSGLLGGSRGSLGSGRGIDASERLRLGLGDNTAPR